MSKLIGKRKRDYLAHVVRQEPSVDPAAAERLTGRLDGVIRSLRVTKADLAELKAGAEPARAPVAAPPAASFDPYAFNAILVFKRQGRDALIARLVEIQAIPHLRQLAEAQLIGLDQDMRSGDVHIEDLREAVLRGVERLVADRRAAAS